MKNKLIYIVLLILTVLICINSVGAATDEFLISEGTKVEQTHNNTAYEKTYLVFGQDIMLKNLTVYDSWTAFDGINVSFRQGEGIRDVVLNNFDRVSGVNNTYLEINVSDGEFTNPSNSDIVFEGLNEDSYKVEKDGVEDTLGNLNSGNFSYDLPGSGVFEFSQFNNSAPSVNSQRIVNPNQFVFGDNISFDANVTDSELSIVKKNASIWLNGSKVAEKGLNAKDNTSFDLNSEIESYFESQSPGNYSSLNVEAAVTYTEDELDSKNPLAEGEISKESMTVKPPNFTSADLNLIDKSVTPTSIELKSNFTGLGSFESLNVTFQYRKQGESNWRSTGILKEISSISNGSEIVKHNISNLQPNTTYEYRVNTSYNPDFQTKVKNVSTMEYGNVKGVVKLDSDLAEIQGDGNIYLNLSLYNDANNLTASKYLKVNEIDASSNYSFSELNPTIFSDDDTDSRIEISIDTDNVSNHGRYQLNNSQVNVNLNSSDYNQSNQFEVQSSLFQIKINEENSTDNLKQGETLSLNYNISNIGDIQGQQDTVLGIKGGSATENITYTLNSGETLSNQEINLSDQQTTIKSGERTFKLYTNDSYNNSDSQKKFNASVNQTLEEFKADVIDVSNRNSDSMKLNITDALDLVGDNFTESRNISIQSIDSKDPSLSNVEFKNGSATQLTILTDSETDSISLGQYNSKTVDINGVTDSFDVFVNAPPAITGKEVIINQASGEEKLKLTLDDKGIGTIDDSSFTGGVDSVEKFTNNTLVVHPSGGFPFSEDITVTDTFGENDTATGIDIDYTVTDLDVRHSFDNNLSTQRANKTVTINSSAPGDTEFNFTFQNYGEIIQNEENTGTITGTGETSITAVWENDWVKNLGENEYETYSNSTYNHSVQTQGFTNQTSLELENTLETSINSLNISNQCMETTTVSLSPGRTNVTNDCNRNFYTGDILTKNFEGVESNSSEDHTENTQYIFKEVTVSVDTGDYSFSSVNLSPPSMPGTCQDCNSRYIDVSAENKNTQFYNSKGDWISTKLGELTQDKSQTSNISKQFQAVPYKANTERNYLEFKEVSLNTSTPQNFLNGTCQNCGSRTTTVPTSGNSTEWFNNTLDNITNVKKSQNQIHNLKPGNQTLGEFKIANQTQLKIQNNAKIQYTDLNISNKCKETKTVDIPTGTNIVTENCTNQTKKTELIHKQVGQLSIPTKVKLENTYKLDLKLNLSEKRGREWNNVDTTQYIENFTPSNACSQQNLTETDIESLNTYSETIRFQCQFGSTSNFNTDSGDGTAKSEFEIKTKSDYTNGNRIEISIDESNLPYWEYREGNLQTSIEGLSKNLLTEKSNQTVNITVEPQFYFEALKQNTQNSHTNTGLDIEINNYNQTIETGETLQADILVENKNSDTPIDDTIELINTQGEVVDAKEITNLAAGANQEFQMEWNTEAGFQEAGRIKAETSDAEWREPVKIGSIDTSLKQGGVLSPYKAKITYDIESGATQTTSEDDETTSTSDSTGSTSGSGSTGGGGGGGAPLLGGGNNEEDNQNSNDSNQGDNLEDNQDRNREQNQTLEEPNEEDQTEVEIQVKESTSQSETGEEVELTPVSENEVVEEVSVYLSNSTNADTTVENIRPSIGVEDNPIRRIAPKGPEPGQYLPDSIFDFLIPGFLKSDNRENKELNKESIKVYKYLETNTDIEKEKIENLEVTFKVETSWLKQNNVEKDELTLRTYNEQNQTWEERKTEIIKSGEKTATYKASINTQGNAVITSQSQKQEVETQKEDSSNLMIKIFSLIAAIIIIIVVKKFGPDKKSKLIKHFLKNSVQETKDEIDDIKWEEDERY